MCTSVFSLGSLGKTSLLGWSLIFCAWYQRPRTSSVKVLLLQTISKMLPQKRILKKMFPLMMLSKMLPLKMIWNIFPPNMFLKVFLLKMLSA